MREFTVKQFDIRDANLGTHILSFFPRQWVSLKGLFNPTDGQFILAGPMTEDSQAKIHEITENPNYKGWVEFGIHHSSADEGWETAYVNKSSMIKESTLWRLIYSIWHRIESGDVNSPKPEDLADLNKGPLFLKRAVLSKEGLEDALIPELQNIVLSYLSVEDEPLPTFNPIAPLPILRPPVFQPQAPQPVNKLPVPPPVFQPQAPQPIIAPTSAVKVPTKAQVELVQAGLFLRIITHPAIKAIAGLLVIAGITTFGLAFCGFVGAEIVGAAGILSTVIGGALLLAGFFANRQPENNASAAQPADPRVSFEV